MTEQEAQQFLLWCEENIKGIEICDADESWHAYWKGEMIGGWDGCRRAFFFKHNDKSALLLRMMDA